MSGNKEKPDFDDSILAIHPLEDGDPILTRVQMDAAAKELAKAKRKDDKRQKQFDEFIRNLPEGWMSETSICSEFALNRRDAYKLLGEILYFCKKNGISEEDTKSKWVRPYSYANGRYDITEYYFSPLAIEELKKQGVLMEKAPPVPENWVSDNSLKGRYRRSAEFGYDGKGMDNLRRRKLAEGLTEEEIHSNWVRKCSKGRRQLFYASPQAINALVELGVLSPRAQSGDDIPYSHRSGRTQATTYTEREEASKASRKMERE